MHILAATNVPFTLSTVQVPNLALTHKKRITVYTRGDFILLFNVLYSTLFHLPSEDAGFGTRTVATFGSQTL